MKGIVKAYVSQMHSHTSFLTVHHELMEVAGTYLEAASTRKQRGALDR